MNSKLYRPADKKDGMILKILSLMTFFLISACATSPATNLHKINVGMEKADVLEVMGNPTRIQRVHSQDRWTYEIRSKENSSISTTYIFFAEGRVTHVDVHGE